MAATLFEYYKGQGKALPPLSERGKLYESYGLGSATTYGGTAAQNTALLGKLQGGGGAAPQAEQPKTSQEVTPYLQQFQQTQFTAATSPEVRIPGKFDINPATGHQYGENPNKGWAQDDTYWAEVVEPQLKAQYGVSTAPSVHIPTMEELGEKLLPETPLPEPLSRVQEFERLRTEQGVAALETTLNDLKAQEEEVQATLRARTEAEEGKPVPLGVIAGRVSEIEKQERRNLEFVQRQINRTVDELNTRYAVINTYVTLLGLDYEDAVKRYEGEFNRNMEMYKIILGKEELALTQFERDRSAAQSNLQIFYNAVTKGNVDYGSLSPGQKMMISKLEAQAGLPIGFIGSLKKDPDADILFTTSNEGVTQVGFRNADGTISVKSYGTRIAGAGTVSERKEARQKDAFSEMSQRLNEVGGDDKLVSPEEWKTHRADWVRGGFSGSDFDAAFRYPHVDESHPQDYNPAWKQPTESL